MSNRHFVDVTDLDFHQRVLAGALPTLVDFSAAWCAPCRVIVPHLAALAERYEGRVQVAKCDVDSNPGLAARYDVRNLPTLLMFKQGQVVGQVVGAVPRAKIEALVERALAP